MYVVKHYISNDLKKKKYCVSGYNINNNNKNSRKYTFLFGCFCDLVGGGA